MAGGPLQKLDLFKMCVCVCVKTTFSTLLTPDTSKLLVKPSLSHLFLSSCRILILCGLIKDDCNVFVSHKTQGVVESCHIRPVVQKEDVVQ